MVLVRNGESTGEGVDVLLDTRLNAGDEIIVLALGDGVLHGEHQVGGVWSLQPEHKLGSRK